MCVQALYSFMCLCMRVLVYEMNHQCWTGVAPSLPAAVSESLLHMAPLGPTISLSRASAKHKDWAKYYAVQEWGEKRLQTCYVIYRHLLSFDSFDQML